MRRHGNGRRRKAGSRRAPAGHASISNKVLRPPHGPTTIHSASTGFRHKRVNHRLTIRFVVIPIRFVAAKVIVQCSDARGKRHFKTKS